MKRGFTLLELVVVIIIIGVLATLGFANYSRMVEKARGAEARRIFGDLRTLAQAYYTSNNNSLAGLVAADLGLGAGGIPIACAGQTSHYFAYSGTGAGAVLTLQADRCGGADGKQPGAAAFVDNALQLVSNFGTGVDTWTNVAPY